MDPVKAEVDELRAEVARVRAEADAEAERGDAMYDRAKAAEAEVERLRAELAEIDARVKGARGIHRRNWVAEARLRKVEALADDLEERGIDRPGDTSRGHRYGIREAARRLRAALAAEPADSEVTE